MNDVLPVDHCCLGAYEECVRLPLGVLYEGWPSGRWTGTTTCMFHFIRYGADFEQLADPPSRIELHAFNSLGPEWTRYFDPYHRDS